MELRKPTDLDKEHAHDSIESEAVVDSWCWFQGGTQSKGQGRKGGSNILSPLFWVFGLVSRNSEGEWPYARTQTLLHTHYAVNYACKGEEGIRLYPRVNEGWNRNFLSLRRRIVPACPPSSVRWGLFAVSEWIYYAWQCAGSSNNNLGTAAQIPVII